MLLLWRWRRWFYNVPWHVRRPPCRRLLMKRGRFWRVANTWTRQTHCTSMLNSCLLERYLLFILLFLKLFICYFVDVEFSVSYSVEGLKYNLLVLHTSVSDNDGYRSSRRRCRSVVVVAVTVAVANYNALCNNNTVPFVLLLLLLLFFNHHLRN